MLHATSSSSVHCFAATSFSVTESKPDTQPCKSQMIKTNDLYPQTPQNDDELLRAYFLLREIGRSKQFIRYIHSQLLLFY